MKYIYVLFIGINLKEKYVYFSFNSNSLFYVSCSEPNSLNFTLVSQFCAGQCNCLCLQSRQALIFDNKLYVGITIVQCLGNSSGIVKAFNRFE